MMRKILSRIGLACLALVMLFSFAGCASDAERVVATAGDQEIYYDEYYFLAMTRLAQLKLEYGEEAMSNPEARAKLEKFVADNLLTESHALLAIARSLGVDIEDDKIADNTDAHMAGILAAEPFLGDREAYLQSLREAYLTERYVRTFVAVHNYLSIEVIKALLENGTLDSSDAAALSFLRSDDVIRVRQVEIKEIVVGDKTILSAEQAKQKAQMLRDQVAQAADRDAAMREAMQSSLDTSGLASDGIYLARGEMEDAYEQAAFGLENNYDVSEVLEHEDGYVFMMLLPKDEQYMQENLEELKGKTYYIVLNRMIQKWLAENPLSMTTFGESLDPAELEVIDPEEDTTWLIVIPVAAAVLLVVIGVFVIRVLVLRDRVKKGKPIVGKKKKFAKK